MRSTLKLREVYDKDCRLIWEWSNDPDVRAVSFSHEPIPYQDHVKWFKSKLKDIDCYFYIAEDINQKPVGQVRYDLEGNEARISVSLDRKFRGKGYGTLLIKLASQKLFVVADVDVIHAYVRRANQASVKAFKKAGFIILENTVINDQQASHFILEKKSG